MFYLLRVTEFIMNVNNLPLRNNDGSAQKEIVYKKRVDVQEIFRLTPDGKKIEKSDGTYVTQNVLIENSYPEEQEIIPTRIQSKEFLAYQEIVPHPDNNELLHKQYFDKKGNVIDLSDNSQALVYEIEIIDQNPALPKWYK